MGYEENKHFKEAVRQHTATKECFRDKYEFKWKQRDILFLAKIDIDHLEKNKRKAEWHVKKSLRDIEKLQKHIIELRESIEGYTDRISDKQAFLNAATTVVESDIHDNT